MRLLGIDLETTGLDINKDRILKFGAILIDTNHEVPLFEKEWTLWHETYPPISEGAYETHHIKKSACTEFGESPIGFYTNLVQFLEQSKVDYLVAHNGHNFDFLMLDANAHAFDIPARGFLAKIKKVDTAQDLPYPENIQTRKLTYLAAEHGFINPFPHSALSDIRTMLKLLSLYPLEEVLKRAESPSIVIEAVVSFDQKDLAKARRFYWDGTTKAWLKRIKACDFAKELEKAEFRIKEL